MKNFVFSLHGLYFGLFYLASPIYAESISEAGVAALARHPIVYNNEPVWYLVGSNSGRVKKRAQAASQKLTKVISELKAKADVTRVTVNARQDGMYLTIFAIGEPIITLSERDANFQDFHSLDDLASAVTEKFHKFILATISMHKLQKSILSVVISILIIALSFIVFRKLGRVFRRWEAMLTKGKKEHDYDAMIELPGLGQCCQRRLLWRCLTTCHLTAKACLFACAFLLIAAQFSLTKGVNSPLHYAVLAIIIAIVLACIPLCAIWLVGAIIVWRSHLKCGDWIEIKGHSGELTVINFQHMRILKQAGEIVFLPTFYAAIYPVFRRRHSLSELESILDS